MLWLHAQMALLDSARAVVSFAANWLLQSTLLIAAGLAVARWLGRRGSALQSAIYRTTLAAVIVCPLASALLARGGVSGWSVELPVAWTYEEQTPPLVSDDARQTVAPPSSTAAANSTPLEPVSRSANLAQNTIFGAETSGEGFLNAQADAGLGGQLPSSNTPVMVSTHSDAVSSTQTFRVKTALFDVRAFGLAAIGVSLIWLAVSAVLLCRLTGAWRRLGQLRRAAVTAEPATQQACRELAASLAVAAPDVRRTPYLASPCLAGLLRPVVLLPEAEASLPLRDVLIHELAHLRRHDGWWNLLMRLTEALFFYQPLLWALARRLESAAEEVCDDYVVQFGGNREDYARGLLEIAERSLAPVGMAGVAMVSLRSILAKRVTRIVDSSRNLSTRVGNLLLTIVIVGGLTGTLVVGFVGLAQHPPANAEPISGTAADNQEQKPSEPNVKTKANRSTSGVAQPEHSLAGAAGTSDLDDLITDNAKDASSIQPSKVAMVRGRVTRGGRPAGGAHVAVIARRTAVKRGGDFGRGDEVLAEVRANENGEYSMTLADVSQKTHANANLIARQDGAAIAWRQLNLDDAETEADLELPDEELVRGKLIDVEGRPARGVQLSVVSAAARTENVHEARGVGYHGRDKTPSAWLAAITSDAQGRFVLHGLAANHGVTLEVAGDDRFAEQDILLNTGAPEQRGERDKTYRPLVKNVKPGEEAGLVLAPAQLFEGTVRYADTGQGVPHARITIWASQEQFGSMMSVAGRADERGHYRISPRPGIRFGVAAYPPDGTAYLARETPPDKAIEWKAIEGSKQVDLTLPRGVLVRGTVVEAGSGARVAGAAVQYQPESLNNRNASNDILTGWQTIQLSDGDGRFTMAVLPGPGRLLVNGPQGKYVLQEIGNRELYSGKPGGARYYVHAHAKLSPAAGQDAVEVKLELAPGATARGRIVDEAGKAIDEALVISRLDVSPLSLFWRGHTTPTLGGRFELTGLAEGVEYPVYFLDPKRRLGATEVIKAGEKERIVVLKPCGKATLRLIDGKGEPMPANYGLFEMVVTPGAARYDRDALERGELAADAEFIANIDRMNNPISPTDDEAGARTMSALIPGAIYRIIAKRDGEIRIVKEFQVKPNEAVDFGDIVVERD